MKSFIENNLIVISLFIIISIFYLLCVNTSGDTYWFMSTGRDVWETKSIPTTASRSYGVIDKSFNSVEWFAGFIYFSFVSVFGINGLLVVRVILAILTLLCIYQTLKIFTKNKLVLNTALLFVSYVLATRTNDRPETFSYLFLAFVNYLNIKYIQEKIFSKLFFIFIPLFLIWPNTHPFAIMGVFLYIFYSGLTLKEKYFDKLSYPKYSVYLAVFFISISLSAVQYKKLFAFLKVRHLAGFFTEFGSLKSRLMLTNGYDFFNQIPIEIYFYTAFFIFYFLFLFIYIKRNKNKALFILPRFGFTTILILLPVYYFRTIPLAILLSIPQLVLLASKVINKTKPNEYILKTFFIILLVLTLSSIPNKEIVGSRENSLVLTITNKAVAEPIGVVNRWWTDKFPVSAPQLIEKHTDAKRLFTDTGWNNYFLWHLPQIETFADAQSYNRTQTDWDMERIIFYGQEGWEDLLNKLEIDVVVNSQPDSTAYVYTPVYNLPNWKLLYVNEIYMLYVREDKIKSYPLDISKIRPDLPENLKYKKEDEDAAIEQLKELVNYDPKNVFARDQLIQYYIDVKSSLQEAKVLAQESRNVLPYEPKFSMHLANIYARENNCLQANNFKEEVYSKSYNHPIYSDLADTYTKKCNL